MTYDRLTIAVPSMSKHHATMIRVATSKMLDASIKYASTNDRRHFDDMVRYQDLLWSVAKQVAATAE